MREKGASISFMEPITISKSSKDYYRLSDMLLMLVNENPAFKISNFLSKMRRSGSIQNIGSRGYPAWKIAERKWHFAERITFFKGKIF